MQLPIHSPLLSAWKTPLAFLSLQGSDKNKNFSLARTFFLCDDSKKGRKFWQEDDHETQDKNNVLSAGRGDLLSVSPEGAGCRLL